MANTSANVKSEPNTTPEAAIKAETVQVGKVPDAGAAANDVCFVTNANPDSLTTVVIEKPAAGETAEVQMAPGQKYFLDMYEKDVTAFEQQDGNLKLVFADGSSIVLIGYSAATSGDLGSTMAFRDDFAIGDVKVVEAAPEEIVEEPKTEHKTEADDVAKTEPAAGDEVATAKELAAIEPTAGEEGGNDPQNTGFTFNDPDITPVGPLAAVGPIDPTLLNYGVNLPRDEVRLVPQAAPNIPPDPSPELAPSVAAVDETNLSPDSPLGARGVMDFDFGSDGPGTLAPSGTFTLSGSALDGQLTSCGELVTVTATANGYVGMVGDRVVFELTVNSSDGSFLFQQFGPLDHNDPNNPDDVLSLVFGIRATDSDGDSATTTITIHVADDGPSVAGPQVHTVDEGDLENGRIVENGMLDFDFGGDGPGSVEVSGGFNFTGVNALTSGGHPIVVTQTPYGYVGMLENTRQMAFEITINADGSYEFVQRFPLDHNPNSNTLGLQFGVGVTDCDGDHVQTVITINVTDSTPKIPNDGTPEIGVDLVIVDETNLPNGSTASGQLDIDYGADGQGSLTSNGTFSSSLANLPTEPVLASGGHPITVVATANGYVGTITVNGVTTTIFTLSVNDDGAYTFTQNEQIDHPNPNNPNEPIRLNFGVTATDGDGDTANGTIRVDVLDDGPVAVDDGNTVLENTLVVDGNVLNNDDVGEDTTGQNGNGEVVSVTFNGQVYTVISGGDDTVINGQYGTLTINSTGQYTYTSFGTNTSPVQDHFTYTIRDFDGDTDTAVLTITIQDADSTPIVATPEPLLVDETNLFPILNHDSGQIVADFGGDGPGTYTATGTNTFSFSGQAGQTLTSDGVPVVVTLVGNDYVGTANGQEVFHLTLNPTTGAYEFVLTGTLDHGDQTNPDDAITLNFGATVTDADGDAVNTNIQVVVRDDGPFITNTVGPVDESGLVNGPVTITQNILHYYGADGDGDIHPTGTVNAYTSTAMTTTHTLTSHGETITITTTADGYVGMVNGQTVFTLVVQDNGQYTYTQFLPIDHPNVNGMDPDDVIWVQFGIEIVDADGDTDQAVITVDIHDGGPVAVDDTLVVSEDAVSASANVIDNDSVGPDLQGTVTSVSFNGVEHPVVAGAITTIVGQYGTLEIGANGSYTYTPFGTNTTQVQDHFTYTLRDFDGDTDTANLTITVQDGDSTPIVATPAPLVVDETNLNPTDHDSDVISVDFGGDGPGTFTATGEGTFSYTGQAGQTLTSDGVPVVVTLVGNDYVGTANGAEVFHLTLNPTTGAYDFTLTGTLDHGDPNNPDDAITLNFGATVTDADGDAVNTNIQVVVRDDGPVVGNDVNNFSAQAQGQDFNVVMMLDVSGSMAGAPIALLQAAVANLVGDLHDYTGGQVMLHLVPFSTNSYGGSTFDISTDEGYAAALAYIDGLQANGLTNYEAPLQNAIDWLQGPGPIDGAATYTYFVSDGAPNRYIDENGQVQSGSDIQILGEITGSDGTNEVGILQGLSTEVIGVGIGVDPTTLSILDIIDSDGNALDVQDPNDLNAAFQGTIPLAGSTSGNVITGQNGGAGAGDDVGADGAVVTSVTFNGFVYAVHPVNGVTIQGLNGVLVMHADGSYTYALDRDATPVNGVVGDQFAYTLTDGDGDRSTGTLTLRATVNPPPTPDVVDIEHGLPVEAQPILVAHGVDAEGDVLLGHPVLVAHAVDDVAIRPNTDRKPATDRIVKDEVKLDPQDHDILVADLDEVVSCQPVPLEFALPVETQPNDAKLARQPVFLGPPVEIDPAFDAKPSIKPVTKPAIKPFDIDPPIDVKPEDTKPSIKPVDIKPIDIDPPIYTKPVDTTGVKPIFLGPPIHIDPAIDARPHTKPGIRPIDIKPIDIDPPIDVKPVDTKPPHIGTHDWIAPPFPGHGKPDDTRRESLKINMIKEIVDVQGYQDVLYGHETDDRLHFGDFGVKPIGGSIDLPKDVVDISSVLHGFDALQESINDFVFASTANDNTVVHVGADGSAGGHAAAQVAILHSVTGLDLDDSVNLAANGQGRV